MKWNKICLMVPTYKRSKSYLPQFITSAIKTMSEPSKVHFCFCVNSGDADTKEYLKALDFKGASWEIIIESLQSPNLAVFFNKMYSETITKNDYSCVVTMMGDDMVFRTLHWDKRMLDLINSYKGIGVFWANDDFIARERLCVNLFVTRQFVEATEHPFMCEEFKADMIDVIWHKVGEYTKTLHFDPETHIWHNHNTSKPKEQWDDCFNRLRPAQEQGHKIGKTRVKEVAEKISKILIHKGMVGNSIC